jgi:hypothetical protein
MRIGLRILFLLEALLSLGAVAGLVRLRRVRALER